MSGIDHGRRGALKNEPKPNRWLAFVTKPRAWAGPEHTHALRTYHHEQQNQKNEKRKTDNKITRANHGHYTKHSTQHKRRRNSRQNTLQKKTFLISAARAKRGHLLPSARYGVGNRCAAYPWAICASEAVDGNTAGNRAAAAEPDPEKQTV